MEQIETGRSLPRREELLALAELYNMPRLRHKFCNDGCPFRVNSGFGGIKGTPA
jgi:hypothetical protein